MALGRLARHHDNGTGAIRDLRGRASGDRAVLGEGRPQAGQPLDGGPRPHAFIGRDRQRLTAALRDRHRDDLLVEDAELLRGGGELVGPGRELVLLLAGDAQLGVVRLGRLAHRALIEGAEQAVVGHRVDQRAVAVLVAAACAGQQVRRIRHRFHAARDDDVVLAGGNQLVGERDRVEPGQADLVDGEGGDGHRDAALDRGLAGGDLAGAGLQHLTHDHVVDGVPRDAGARQRRFDRDPAEVDCGQIGQRAEQLANRSAGTTDDHRTRHD